MATIKDIARLAGVGTSTVSRALNGGHRVDKKTYDRVYRAVRRLGYKPNYAARDLVRGSFSKKTIGAVLPLLYHPFFSEVIRGVYDAVTGADYNIMLFNTAKNRADVLRHIIREGLAGLVFVSEGLDEGEKTMIDMNHGHYVMVDHYQEGIESFFIDNKKGGRLAAEWLISRGCARIAYIGEDIKTQQQEDRFGGFQNELEKNGLKLLADKRVPVDEEKARQATLSLVKEFPSVDGIFYFCDRLAYGGLKARGAAGGRYRIVGYDDMPLSEHLGLTTIRQPAYEMGYQSAEKLVKSFAKSAGRQMPTANRFFPELVERGS